jgi:hypothetical protein
MPCADRGGAVWINRGSTRRDAGGPRQTMPTQRHRAGWLLLPCAAIAAGFAVRRVLGISSGSQMLEQSPLALLQVGASPFWGAFKPR